MKFIHAADVHLGVSPDAGRNQIEKRRREIWNSFERLLEVCEEEKTDLLLIAGDMFHRQPLMRELKEVNYLFSKLSVTQVVFIVGNHDYLKKDSYYHGFKWSQNVHPILNKEFVCIEFSKIQTAVYGASYHSREIKEKIYRNAYAEARQKYEILMIHGGDEMHIPMQKTELLDLGYDYVALGHIHKPGAIVPGKVEYAGALEPIDKNDTGVHGYIKGELTEKGCHATFVPFAQREYKHVEISVSKKTTGYELREMIQKVIEEQGREHIYKINLRGFKDSEIYFDLPAMDVYGNIVEIIDHTKPAYQFDKLFQDNQDNILGGLIECFRDYPEDSVEYLAMCEGVKALIETRRN